MKTITIVGAGASGVYTSILLKQKLKELCRVVVIEANASPLKKLLATGNGRCNLSNLDMSIKHYDGNDIYRIEPLLQNYNIVDELKRIHIYTKYLGNLLYPRNEQALSVKERLYQQSLNEGVEYVFDCFVQDIDYKGSYYLKTSKGDFKTDYLIIAVGSSASSLSTPHDRKALFHRFKIHYKEMVPSLVSMNTKQVFKNAKGVRVKGTFTLTNNGKTLHQEKGELLFTEYGVSGIAVMQLSRYYEQGCQIHLNMVDDLSKEEVLTMVEEVEDHPLDSFLPMKLSKALESKKEYQDIYRTLTDLTLDVASLRDKEYAQVLKGGILLNNLSDSFEFIKYKHMYAIGEIVDVTGDCGGYNLHFAFASGYAVANAIEGSIHD